MRTIRQESPLLVLRIATDADERTVARLAALDSAPAPAAPILLVELDGEPAVAVSLRDLATVADPFRPTEELRRLALARARQLRNPTGPQRSWRHPLAGRRGRPGPRERTGTAQTRAAR